MRTVYCAMLVVTVMGLGGCGVNQVRVASAGNVATVGDTVVADAKAILADAAARETKARVTLVASDATCMPKYPMYIYVPDGTPPSPGVTVPFCADGSVDGQNYAGYTRMPINLAGPTRDALKPSLEMIAAIAAYDDALATIVASPTTDVTADFDSALAQAKTAYADATAVGISLPAAPTLTDAQETTALALVQMFADLAHEQQQASQLRQVFTDQAGALGSYCDPTVDMDVSPCLSSGTFAQIADQMAKWSKATATISSQITVESLLNAYHDERGKLLDFDGRQAFVTTIEATRHDVAETPKTLFAFERALAALSQANHDLATALYNPSAEQRAEAARISEQRVLHALGLVAAAINAWKGI